MSNFIVYVVTHPVVVTLVATLVAFFLSFYSIKLFIKKLAKGVYSNQLDWMGHNLISRKSNKLQQWVV